MNCARALAAVIALTALGLTSCGDADQADPESQGSEEQNAEESAAEDIGDEDSKDDDVDGESITVHTEGQGPYGLFTSDVPTGESREISGKLIIGPGSCFALTGNGQPELLVFGDDAEFVLREGQPSVTTDGTGTLNVGEQVELSVTEISQDSADGIPTQCTQGAADTVLITD